MTSLVLGDLIRECITPSVNVPLVATKCQLQPHQPTSVNTLGLCDSAPNPQVDQPLETC